MANSIKPNRNDLAKFLPDQRLIRAFEQLFEYVPASIDANTIDSYNSQTSAQQALDTVEALRSVIELASTAPAQQANQIAELAQQVALLSQAPPVEQKKLPRYGTFYDTTTQTAAAINTAYGVTFDSTDLSFGVSIGTPASRIYVDSEGVCTTSSSRCNWTRFLAALACSICGRESTALTKPTRPPRYESKATTQKVLQRGTSCIR